MSIIDYIYQYFINEVFKSSQLLGSFQVPLALTFTAISTLAVLYSTFWLARWIIRFISFHFWWDL